MSSTALESAERAAAPFAHAVQAIMRTRGISVRQLARDTGVSAGHLSRVLRGADGKRASSDLIARVGTSLGLPDDFFVEQRRQRLLILLDADPTIIDGLVAEGARVRPSRRDRA